MDTTIYNKIEKEIKKTDYYMREYFITNIIYYIFSILISVTIPIIMLYNNTGWIALSSEFVLLAFFIQFVKFKIVYEISHTEYYDSIKQIGLTKRLDFFNFTKIDQMAKILKKENLPVLKIIIKCGIATNEGLEEIIKHYRFRASESKQLPVDFIAIFTSYISIVGLLISEKESYMQVTSIMLVLILIIIFLVYIAVLCLSRITFAKFSKKAFYTRIECALSEIRALDKLSSNEEK
ncbi:MAG: hypothetical protein K2J01_06645 [Clostridiales bacterium]|nr:hypothetical protein [Clostridiales bacterium]